MTKIWMRIQFEGPVEAEELVSCIEEALVEHKTKGVPFAGTGEGEPIKITRWNTEWSTTK